MVENDEFLIIGQQVTNAVFLEKLADVAFHFLNGLPLFVSTFLLFVFIFSLHSLPQAVNGILIAAVPGVGVKRAVFHRVVLQLVLARKSNSTF